MSEFDRRLKAAVLMGLNPKEVSPEYVWFAWRPVWGWKPESKRHGWLWLRKVTAFCPLGMWWEYYGIESNGEK